MASAAGVRRGRAVGGVRPDVADEAPEVMEVRPFEAGPRRQEVAGAPVPTGLSGRPDRLPYSSST